MIVFAVHDRVDLIFQVFEKLEKFNFRDVLVVDTNSKNNNVFNFYNSLNKSQYKFNIFYDRINHDCYDSGAYIHSFQKYDYETFYFFQDSVEFINEKIFEEIDNLLIENQVVAIASFPLIFDSQIQMDWVISDIPEYINLNFNQIKGIFGPMFSIKKTNLELINKNWLSIPSNKLQACGMERKWSIIFNLLGFKTYYLEGDYMSFLSQSQNKYINKKMINRQ
jgi:hypothetical protein